MPPRKRKLRMYTASEISVRPSPLASPRENVAPPETPTRTKPTLVSEVRCGETEYLEADVVDTVLRVHVRRRTLGRCAAVAEVPEPARDVAHARVDELDGEGTVSRSAERR
jgi:hypothetical protein